MGKEISIGLEGKTTPRIVILGAGMSGLCMAIGLRKAGFTSFTILEKASGIGGTWWHSTYPGAQCDVRSHLYSYSFALNPDWTRTFASQSEIQAYMARCANKYNLLSHIRLNTEVIEARFEAKQGVWTLRTRCGETITAEIFVCSLGSLHQPRYPGIPGLATFAGKMFHSSRWENDYDFTDKRIAVIGNAASAVQIIPQVATSAAQLSVFQRSPNWILPRPERNYATWEKMLFRITPMARAYRYCLYWLHEGNRLALNPGSLAAKYATRIAEKHLYAQISDEKLRAVLRPDYPIGCKRVLVSSDYYPTLNRSNVELVTNRIECITQNGMVTSDGRTRTVDAIICATGFNSMHLLSSIPIEGLSGATLADTWKNIPQAYHGITVAGLPNFFLLLGPNTGQGHTSTLIFIEAQVEYTIRCIRELTKRRRSYLTVKPDAMNRHNEDLQKALRHSAWAGDCRSWYKTSEGKIVAIYPGFSFQYIRELKRPKFADYLFG